jgi:thiol-disulfide isomerase/thioredoxin
LSGQPAVHRGALVAGLLIVLPLVGVLFLNLGRNPQAISSPLVGKAAPGFKLVPIGGGPPVGLDAYRGRPVVLNFWATWCAPCVLELPTLDKLQAELGGAKFEVVAVSVDLRGIDKVGPFWTEKGYKHLAIRLDQRGAMMKAFGTRGLPTTFLVDHEGNVVGYLEGHADWASPEAKALMRYYIDRAGR